MRTPFFITGLLLLGSRALANPVCDSWVLSKLGFTPSQAARIDPSSLPSTEFLFRLRDLEVSPPPEECRTVRDQVADHLAAFLLTRWSSHLAGNRLQDFSIEVARFHGTFRQGSIPVRYEAGIRRLCRIYIETIRRRLVDRIQGSSWTSWMQTLESLSLEEWTPEWTDQLRSTSRAAIRLDQSRVALDVMNAGVLDLEILLFHELAHAVSWSAPRATPDALHANEVFAWRETFAFGAYLERQGVHLPDWFISARRLATRTTNLNYFAEGALRSRGIDLIRP